MLGKPSTGWQEWHPHIVVILLIAQAKPESEEDEHERDPSGRQRGTAERARLAMHTDDTLTTLLSCVDSCVGQTNFWLTDFVRLLCTRVDFGPQQVPRGPAARA